MKNIICTICGVVASAITCLFGGWSTGLTTLLICMAVDFITGLICAAVFHKSPKTKTGTLESRAGFKGLCRKGAILLIVLIGYRLDIMIETTYIRDAVCFAFTANEIISIIENLGLMGVYVPPVIIKAIDVLKNKSENEDLKG